MTPVAADAHAVPLPVDAIVNRAHTTPNTSALVEGDAAAPFANAVIGWLGVRVPQRLTDCVR